MNTNIILDRIDNDILDSEIDVLIAIGESYHKILNILSYSDYDEAVIMESYSIFIESDNDSEKASVGKKIKELFKKVLGYIQAAIKKITDIFEKKILKSDKFVIASANAAAIADAIVNKNYVVTEGFEDLDDYDDIYQEAKSEEEKKADDDRKRMMRAAAIKKHQHKKEYKERARMEKKLEKADELAKAGEKEKADKMLNKIDDESKKKLIQTITKEYSTKLSQKLLTKDEINKLVDHIIQMNSREDYIKFQQDLKKAQSDPKFKKVLEATNYNMKFCNAITEHYKKINANKSELLRQYNLSKMKKVLSKEEIERRVALIESFSNTLGSALNEMTNTDNFSSTNMTNALYGNGSLFALTASAMANLYDKIKIGAMEAKSANEAMRYYGMLMYESHIDFDDAVYEDNKERKELGMKLDKISETVLFSLNQIKENSYGWLDEWINGRAFEKNNIFCIYLGGPIGAVCKIIGLAVFGPVALIPNPVDPLMFFAQKKIAKTMNPGIKKESKRHYERTHPRETAALKQYENDEKNKGV